MRKEKIIYLSNEEARVIIPDEMEDRIRRVISAIQNEENLDSVQPINITVPFEDDVSIFISLDPKASDAVYVSLSAGNSQYDSDRSEEPDDFFSSWCLTYMWYNYRVEIVSEREALSEELFGHGYNAISDFVGYDFDPDEDKDTTQNRIDEAYAQMPEEELEKFLSKYGLSDGDNPSEEELDAETDLALAVEAFQHDVVCALNTPDFGLDISHAVNVPDNELWLYWEWSRLGKSGIEKFKLPQKKITAKTVTQVRAWLYQMIIVIINQR